MVVDKPHERKGVKMCRIHIFYGSMIVLLLLLYLHYRMMR